MIRLELRDENYHLGNAPAVRSAVLNADQTRMRRADLLSEALLSRQCAVGRRAAPARQDLSLQDVKVPAICTVEGRPHPPAASVYQRKLLVDQRCMMAAQATSRASIHRRRTSTSTGSMKRSKRYEWQAGAGNIPLLVEQLGCLVANVRDRCPARKTGRASSALGDAPGVYVKVKSQADRAPVRAHHQARPSGAFISAPIRRAGTSPSAPSVALPLERTPPRLPS
jgi:hypothetical protein